MEQVYEITGIDWDTDGAEAQLPEAATLHLTLEEHDDVEERLADVLSERYGFTVKQFEYALSLAVA